eukprot:326210-Rhodomonas_salina.2
MPCKLHDKARSVGAREDEGHEAALGSAHGLLHVQIATDSAGASVRAEWDMVRGQESTRETRRGKKRRGRVRKMRREGDQERRREGERGERERREREREEKRKEAEQEGGWRAEGEGERGKKGRREDTEKCRERERVFASATLRSSIGGILCTDAPSIKSSRSPAIPRPLSHFPTSHKGGAHGRASAQ